jgi:hypothetical protein
LRTGPILEKNAWGWCWNRKKIGCQSQAHSGYLRVVRAIKTISGAILSGPLRFFEIARVLVRFDHVASGIAPVHIILPLPPAPKVAVSAQ